MDLAAAITFVSTHARLLEWRRLQHLRGVGSAAGVLAALDGFRNADGGYGWGLEPDLRSATSQPVAAMHALEVLAEVGDTERGSSLCDWLASHSLADGGVPFALPYPDKVGSAPHWAGADPAVSSLQMTTQLAAQAHRAGLAGHPWLTAATNYCLDALSLASFSPASPSPSSPSSSSPSPSSLSPYELMFSMQFLDAVAPGDERAAALLERTTQLVRVDGPTPIAGGVEGEVLHPLDFTPHPGAPSRAWFDPEAIAADVARLAAGQQADGGWAVSFEAFSPAAALEWRGYATVQAVATLRSHAAF